MATMSKELEDGDDDWLMLEEKMQGMEDTERRRKTKGVRYCKMKTTERIRKIMGKMPFDPCILLTF